MKQNLLEFDAAGLTAWFAGMGEKPFRAKQVLRWLHQFGEDDFERMTDVAKSLRTRLAEHAEVRLPQVLRDSTASDGTRKWLLDVGNGNAVECVFIPEENRGTLCISTQAGCAMGCVFCATGQLGFKRNLSSGEIVVQVMYYAQMLKEQNETVSNVVFMGMGEPFHNYDNVMAAIDQLNDADGFKFGARRLTISTVGLAPQIRRFADEQRQVNLAISLHAADDNERLAIMPVNKKYKIDDVIEACKYYIEKTHRRVTFEWALINGVNDTPEVAQKLAKRLKGLLCHVNAIPLNPTQGYDGEATDRQRAQAFKETLEHAGIPCTIRMRRGIDINAGCGQLAGAESEK